MVRFGPRSLDLAVAERIWYMEWGHSFCIARCHVQTPLIVVESLRFLQLQGRVTLLNVTFPIRCGCEWVHISHCICFLIVFRFSFFAMTLLVFFKTVQVHYILLTCLTYLTCVSANVIVCLLYTLNILLLLSIERIAI